MTRREVYIALSQFCKDGDSPRAALAAAGFKVRENRFGRRLKRDEMVSQIGNAEGVVAGVEPYDAEILAGIPMLRCISRCGVGTDAIDLAAAASKGIRVFNTPDEVVEPVAQMTLAMILALARNFPSYAADFKAGRWQRYPGFLLEEWTVGIVGFGRIGRTVARYLKPLRPRMLVYDPNVNPAEVGDHVEWSGFRTLLAESDLVTLHAGRPVSEGPLIGGGEIATMKEGARLVNTARGYLIDEAALYQALKDRRLSGAALDVYEMEPYSGPLAGLSEVLCTPHVSTLTNASRRAMEMKAVRNIIDFLSQGD